MRSGPFAFFRDCSAPLMGNFLCRSLLRLKNSVQHRLVSGSVVCHPSINHFFRECFLVLGPVTGFYGMNMLQTFKLLDRSICSSRLVVCVLLRFNYPTGLSSLIIGCECKRTPILVLVLVRSKILPIPGSSNPPFLHFRC